VTIVPPGSASPGNDSPGAAVTGVTDAIVSGQYTAVCTYMRPSAASSCSATMSQVTASMMPTIQNFGIGYTAIEGDKALGGTTGTFCGQGAGQCYTNTDPAAILDSGQSFDSLWTQAGNASSTAYSLAQVIGVDGRWYLNASP